jgi:hypothetical protein
MQKYLRSQDFHRLNASKLRQRCRVTDRACSCDRFTAVKRAVASLSAFLALMAVAAPAALADNGVGLAGPTTDKTVTFFCLGVLVFFVALVVIMSLVQGKLEKRKDQRRSDLQRLS